MAQGGYGGAQPALLPVMKRDALGVNRQRITFGVVGSGGALQRLDGGAGSFLRTRDERQFKAGGLRGGLEAPDQGGHGLAGQRRIQAQPRAVRKLKEARLTD